jgi:hypothetical protein
MPEFKEMPSPFGKYKINKYGSIVRDEDNYEPLVSLDLVAKIYNDAGEQKEINVVPIVRQLFPGSLAEAVTRLPSRPGVRRTTRRNVGSARLSAVVAPPPVASALEQEVIGLNTHKHFKAYILRSLGWSRRRIASALFNGNGGAARNAEILYTQRPAIINESARRLKRRLGFPTGYEVLRNRLGNDILPNI